MRHLMLLAGLVFAMGSSWLWAEDVARPVTGEEKLIAGFEGDEVPKDWYGADAKLSLVEEHATEGKKSLCAEMSPGDYPGIGVELRRQDWSQYDALRFSVYVARGGQTWVSIRIDETASKGYATRVNLEDHAVAVRFNSGANEIEIPIASLKQGTPESQGIDAARVKLLRIFVGGLKKPMVWHLDNFRLVREERKPPDALVVADFDKVEGKVTPAGGTNVAVVDSPDARGGKSLKLDLTPDAEYPGVAVAMPQNWLSYDLLVMNVFCPEAAATPSGMCLKVTGADGRSMTLSTGLAKGMNEICVPMETASFVSLGRVREFSLFWGRRPGIETVYIDNIRLERAKLVDAPSRHNLAADTDRLVIDFSGLQVGKNTCYMVTMWVPLKDGTSRVVRANAPVKAQLTYGIDADAFADYAEGKPLRVWVLFLDHGVWYVSETLLPLKPAGQTKLTIDDRARFGM